MTETSRNIVVPELGESVYEARVARWLKQAGDRVDAGEAIVELETEKANLEVAAPAAGVLASIAQGEGADVKVGDVLGLVGPGAPSAEREKSGEPAGWTPRGPKSPGADRPKAQREAAREGGESGAKGGPEVAGDSGPEATPAAEPESAAAPQHRAARPVAVTDTRQGRQAPRTPAAADARTPPAPREAAPQPAEVHTGERPVERVRLSKRRLTIARRLVEAQRTAAILTTFNDVDMGRILEIRQRQRDAFEARHGVRLGLVSFFVRASVIALREHPWLNAEMDGEEAILKRYYDIGVAVGAEEGLVVPVLRDADRMSFAEIEHAIKDFSDRAAARTLTLDDLRGGTFTITNGGVFGSLLSTPILNPPQVAILGLHRIEDRPRALEGQAIVRPMMYVALSYDHRLVDGRGAVQFLGRIKDLVEDPGRMLLEK